MMSAGCDDPPSDRCGDSSIMIDGIEVSLKVSYVFVLSGYRGAIRYTYFNIVLVVCVNWFTEAV